MCPTNYPTIRGRSYKLFDPIAYINDLQNVDWTNVITCPDLDQAVEIFSKLFNDIYDIHAPWKVYQRRKNYAPWVTEELKLLIQSRDHWKEVVKNSTTEQERENAQSMFKYYRNKINNKKKFDEINYKKDKFDKMLNPPKRHG